MFKQFFIVFLCLHTKFTFFTADLNGENSTLHFTCPESVLFHIFILFKINFCEIGNLLPTSQSDVKVSTCFSPIAFKSSFIDLNLVRWSGINCFTVISRLTSEENLWQKAWLSSLWLVVESARISFWSRQSSNATITQINSGLKAKSFPVNKGWITHLIK